MGDWKDWLPLLKSRDIFGESSVIEPRAPLLLTVEGRRDDWTFVSLGDRGTRLREWASIEPLQELSSCMRASINRWSLLKSLTSLWRSPGKSTWLPIFLCRTLNHTVWVFMKFFRHADINLAVSAYSLGNSSFRVSFRARNCSPCSVVFLSGLSPRSLIAL